MNNPTYNMEVNQYASYTLPTTYTDNNGNPIDLTGYTANMTVAERSSDTGTSREIILALSDQSGLVLGGIAGTLTVDITDEQTGELTPDTYIYDILLTDPSGNKTRYLEGTFTVLSGITQS